MFWHLEHETRAFPLRQCLTFNHGNHPHELQGAQYEAVSSGGVVTSPDYKLPYLTLT